MINGGTAGLIWGYLIVWIGYMLVFATIAEMASMAPTSGGQYHWVSEFAPRSSQKFVSYLVGKKPMILNNETYAQWFRLDFCLGMANRPRFARLFSRHHDTSTHG